MRQVGEEAGPQGLVRTGGGRDAGESDCDDERHRRNNSFFTA